MAEPMKVLHVRLLYVLVFVILICVLCGAAFVWFHTTKVTISNTVETGGIDRPGINLGGLGNYGAQQLFKSLNYASGGYFPGTYAGTTYSVQFRRFNTTTTWYNNITDGSGYPANFWAGASYVAINAATGSSYGSGTVTASTSNQGSMGTTFTLDPALSAPCSPSQKDVLIVRQTECERYACPQSVVQGLLRRLPGTRAIPLQIRATRSTALKCRRAASLLSISTRRSRTEQIRMHHSPHSR